MENVQKRINENAVLIASAISIPLTYRSVRKNPGKVIRARKRGPFISAGTIIVFAGLKQVMIKNSKDAEHLKMAQDLDLKPMVATLGVSLLTSAVGLRILGGRSEISDREAGIYTAVTSGIGIAYALVLQRYKVQAEAAKLQAEKAARQARTTDRVSKSAPVGLKETPSLSIQAERAARRGSGAHGVN